MHPAFCLHAISCKARATGTSRAWGLGSRSFSQDSITQDKICWVLSLLGLPHSPTTTKTAMAWTCNRGIQTARPKGNSFSHTSRGSRELSSMHYILICCSGCCWRAPGVLTPSSATEDAKLRHRRTGSHFSEHASILSDFQSQPSKQLIAIQSAWKPLLGVLGFTPWV